MNEGKSSLIPEGCEAEAVRELLDGNFSLDTLTVGEVYEAITDDTDGDLTKGWMRLQIGPDSDAHIRIDNARCRFRSAFGGGKSLRVRRALEILAEAMRLDQLDKEPPEGEEAKE